jgi:hypothetical protein
MLWALGITRHSFILLQFRELARIAITLGDR